MEKTTKQSHKDIIKVVIYGPESTGKTTLSSDLATYYSTNWVPEFAREYLQKKWDNFGEKCSREDLLFIAQQQINLENELIHTANKFLFCDTNILITRVWSEIYFEGFCDPKILNLINALHYDNYILTDIDVPWEADDLRDMPNQREMLYQYHKKILESYGLNYLRVSGTPDERIKKVVTYLNQMYR
ncbi:MAG: ATP-binding protein [Flavobacteriaceae bacterium]|nr:ATP-binding protein [Flavobacteriaceae bacterium]